MSKQCRFGFVGMILNLFIYLFTRISKKDRKSCAILIEPTIWNCLLTQVTALNIWDKFWLITSKLCYKKKMMIFIIISSNSSFMCKMCLISFFLGMKFRSQQNVAQPLAQVANLWSLSLNILQQNTVYVMDFSYLLAM